MKLFSIYDRATEGFNQPFVQPTANAALRIIKNEMQQQNSMLAAHPSDYELWEIGHMNPQTGELTAKKERVARLEDLAQTTTRTEGPANA